MTFARDPVRPVRKASKLVLRFALAALAAMPASARAQDAGPQPLNPERAAEIRAHVLPSEDEQAWKHLGWRASLWDAVIDAQAAQKPILLWAMNGHPLGCT